MVSNGTCFVRHLSSTDSRIRAAPVFNSSMLQVCTLNLLSEF